MGTPDSIKFRCTACGRGTRANKLTGRLYSHQLPGELKVCTSSGSVVLRPRGGEPAVPPALRSPAPAAVHDQGRPVAEGPSTSVRVVLSGLPGLGKRR